MYRIILFLVLIALAAAGAAWIADQTGDVTLSWGGWRVHTSLPVFVLGLGGAIVAGDAGVDHAARALAQCLNVSGAAGAKRRHARGRHAITHGLLAIGHGDSTAARLHAGVRASPCRARSAGVIAARAIGATRRRPRRRQGRVPRHGRA